MKEEYSRRKTIEENPVDSVFISSLEEISIVGRYEIKRKLGQGSSGVVYLGKDPYIERNVAIKISPTTTDSSRRRFLVEAQSAGRLNHPNIVVIYDAGVQGDFCYITMEYVEGSNLDEVCSKDRLLPLIRAAEIISDVCYGLEYAHKQGVIHRDIKPSNIMLDKVGHTKITDFGTAQMTDKTLTTGFLGTPSYMSPEQLKDEGVGIQSDIFSLGCVLYELLSGRQAFPGNNDYSTIYKIINEEPVPVLDIRQDLPRIMEEITKKALAKDPKERYQSCMDFAYDLRVALRGLIGVVSKDDEIKDAVDYVNHLTFFSNFTEDQVKELVSIGSIIKVPKGEVIVAEGEIDDTFYIILSGKVNVRKNNQDIALISEGECFGEMACIGGQTRIADVVAETDCQLMKISATLLDRSSETIKFLFYKNFASTLVRRFTHASEEKA